MDGAGNGRFGDPSTDVVQGTSTRSMLECSRATNDVMLKSYSIGLNNHAPRPSASGAAVPISLGPENTQDGTLLKNGEFSPVLSSDLISYFQNGTLGRYSTNSDSSFHFPPFPQPDVHQPAQFSPPLSLDERLLMAGWEHL